MSDNLAAPPQQEGGQMPTGQEPMLYTLWQRIGDGEWRALNVDTRTRVEKSAKSLRAYGRDHHEDFPDHQVLVLPAYERPEGYEPLKRKMR
jgi:hypothetical protein